MKKIIFLWIAVAAFIGGCSENEHQVWDTRAGVYFPAYTAEADSLLYSFRVTGLETDTVRLEVKLQGDVPTDDKKFSIVAGETSTAVAGQHYEALADTYVFPAGETVVKVPVVIFKKGDDLDDETVMLALQLKATDDLDVALPGRDQVRLLLTNQLIRPYYWEMPLELYFGAYSQVKHLKCIEIMGHDFPLQEADLRGYGGLSGYTYWMRAGRQVCNYYSHHTEQDENGNQITTWEPL